MKYQVYLNKKTSEFINKYAELDAKKPNTIIKELIESFVKLSEPVEVKIFEELSSKHGTNK
jgi:DNA-directed RNA polymerase subunit F